MAVTAKRVTLWRKEIENRPGALAGALQSLSEGKSDLQVLMAYRYPGTEDKGAVEVYPVSGKKLTTAAQNAGLSQSSIPVLLRHRRLFRSAGRHT